VKWALERVITFLKFATIKKNQILIYKSIVLSNFFFGSIRTLQDLSGGVFALIIERNVPTYYFINNTAIKRQLA